MINAKCRCGKVNFGSEAMAGETSQCMKCGATIVFPAPRRKPALATAAAPATSPSNIAASLGSSTPAEGMAAVATGALNAQDGQQPAVPPVPHLPRRGVDLLYGFLLLALIPLVTALMNDETGNIKKRLDKTLESSPALKDRVERYMLEEDASLDGLVRLLPNKKLDNLAWLPRDTRDHEYYAAASAGAFFLVVGVFMAWGVTSWWKLILTGLFTATFGIASLFIFQDMFGEYYEGLLHPGGKVGENFIANLLGFTFGVGLGEELCKALPVIFYIRTHRDASWRGACLWGLASGVGFGVAEGVMYSVRYYNGISGLDMYLTRFAACVSLHAVWSASVGITLFQARRVVSKAINMVIYGDIHEKDFDWEEIIMPTIRVLGVAMVLHGSYDTLLTQQMVMPALVVALISFAWLGYQIESIREEELKELIEQADHVPIPALV